MTRTVSASDLDTLLEEEESACAKLCSSVPTPLIVLGAVLAWLLGGAGVYSWLNGWPFLQSYYYAVNVGWSIGFGALVEQNDASRLFSVLMICLGAGAVGGGLGYFVQLNLEASDDFAAKVRERESKRLVFGVDNDGDGDVDATDFFLFVWQSVRHAYKEHTVRINCFLALALWLLVGVLFGMFNQEWTFVTSLYFAVSSLSTGGLQGVNTRVTEDGVTLLTGKGGNALVSLFTGVYTMSGVPVFGVALGQFAGFFVDAYVAKKEEEAMMRELTIEEFDFVKKLGTDDDQIGARESRARVGPPRALRSAPLSPRGGAARRLRRVPRARAAAAREDRPRHALARQARVREARRGRLGRDHVGRDRRAPQEAGGRAQESRDRGEVARQGARREQGAGEAAEREDHRRGGRRARVGAPLVDAGAGLSSPREGRMNGGKPGPSWLRGRPSALNVGTNECNVLFGLTRPAQRALSVAAVPPGP